MTSTVIDTEAVQGETDLRTGEITTVVTNLLPGKTKITKPTITILIAQTNLLKITKWAQVVMQVVARPMAGKKLMIVGLARIIMPRTVKGGIIEGKVALIGIRKTTITRLNGRRSRIRDGNNRLTIRNKARYDQLMKRICRLLVTAGQTNNQIMPESTIQYGTISSILRAVTM